MLTSAGFLSYRTEIPKNRPVAMLKNTVPSQNSAENSMVFNASISSKSRASMENFEELKKNTLNIKQTNALKLAIIKV